MANSVSTTLEIASKQRAKGISIVHPQKKEKIIAESKFSLEQTDIVFIIEALHTLGSAVKELIKNYTVHTYATEYNYTTVWWNRHAARTSTILKIQVLIYKTVQGA